MSTTGAGPAPVSDVERVVDESRRSAQVGRETGRNGGIVAGVDARRAKEQAVVAAQRVDEERIRVEVVGARPTALDEGVMDRGGGRTDQRDRIGAVVPQDGRS
jgi:hypothetical protein